MFLLSFLSKEPNLTEPWALLRYIKLKEPRKALWIIFEPLHNREEGRAGWGGIIFQALSLPASSPSCLFHMVLALLLPCKWIHTEVHTDRAER